jgi:hypothetical protein
MEQDKWIFDIQAGELINLKECKGIWIYKNWEKEEDYKAAHTLRFSYYNGKDYYLHYESSEELLNALEHYAQIVGSTELDVSKKPVTL